MKKLITILFICFSIFSNATVYYVQDTAYNNNASDSNAGTDIDYPWATPQKAFETADAGDTVYFRDGVWYITGFTSGTNILEINPDNSIGHNGAPNNYINYWAYPGEHPIFDFRYAVWDGEWSDHRYLTGLMITDAHWIYWKGLTFRNLYQREEGIEVKCIYAEPFSNFIFEEMVLHTIGGPAFYVHGAVGVTGGGYGWDETGYIPYDSTYFINCDVYQIADTLPRVIGGQTGNQGDGFKLLGYPGSYYSFTGCRAWHCVDDGFDVPTQGRLELINNWSFNNLYVDYPDFEGNGFKFTAGSADESDTTNKLIFINNLSAYNDLGLYLIQHTELERRRDRIYNNTIYKTNIGIQVSDYQFGDTTMVVFRNNLIYSPTSVDNGSRPYYMDINEYYIESHNTWDYAESGSLPNWTYTDTVTVTDADFAMIDSVTAIAQMSAPRKADGSLPDITFLKLAAGSDLIDAGTQIPESDSSGVTLAFNGLAPDIGYSEYAQIIADHTVVDKYDDIPQQWIDSVKTMWLSIPGESHSFAYREGMWYLNGEDATYASNVTGSGTPETPTSSHLRVSSSTWGDLTNETGWIYSYGEEDWFTSAPAIARTKAGLTYANAISNPISAIGFGWCWDLGTSAPDYVQATKEYITYTADSIPTTVFFTTGPVDTYTGEDGYNQYLKYETIRDSVSADPSRILFDYADILSYDYDGTTNTTTYDGHEYPIITTKNLGDGSVGHVSDTASVRLAKAMWWMLARVAGWDGLTTTAQEVDSTAHNILTFTLTAQTGAATIDTANHTVSIEVEYGTSVTSLSPTITVSEGATISPTSGTATNFTSPVVYTVTALDTSTQEWTVTVTVAAAPAVPMGRIGQGTDRRVNQGSAIRVYL